MMPLLAVDTPSGLLGLAIGLAAGLALALAFGFRPWKRPAPAPTDLLTDFPPSAGLLTRSGSEAHSQLLERVATLTEALIVVLDHEGRVVKFNPTCVRLTGYQPEEVLGKTIWNTILSAAECDKIKARVLAADYKEEGETCESDWIDKQGRKHRVMWRCATFRRPDKPPLTVATGLDITESRRMQTELFDAQRVEAIGQLASGIAHDFNNLLTAIFGHIALAKRLLPESHAASASLDRVEQAAEQAGRVIRSLLTFSTNEHSPKIPTPVAHLLSETSSLIEGLLPASIVLETPKTADHLWLNADRHRIQQAIINLAINAKEAMPSGGTLRLAAERQDDRIIFTVADTGRGMSEELLQRACEPFFTTKARGNGTGLGLPVARSIVNDHGGTLEILSTPGHGTTVRISLPAASAPAEVTPKRKPSGLGLIVASTQAYPRQIMVASLSTLQMPIRAHRDAEALQNDLRTGPKAGVLVVDCSLVASTPDILELAAARGTRVIMVGTAEQCAGAPKGAEATLAEPFTTAQLVDLVRSAADQTGAGKASTAAV
jgi:PAS domain S-box-containing protein